MGLFVEVLLAITAIALIILLYFYISKYRVLKFFQQFPTPPGNFLRGNAGDITKYSGLLNTFHIYVKNYGPLVRVRLGPFINTLLCTDYKLIEFVMNSNKILNKSPNFRFLKPWLGDGLVTIDGGPKWKSHRRIITPAFHFQILQEFVNVFEAHGTILVQKLSEQNGNPSFDIYPYITRYALDVICETAMGTKINSQDNKNSAYVKAVKEMCRIFLSRTTSQSGRNSYLFRFSRDYHIQKEAVKILHEYTNSVIDSKRDHQSNGSKSQLEDFDLEIKKRQAFLDLILKASVNGEVLSRQEIRQEVDTFMFAGHDTTATAISFILYCIANHKEVQDKILEEQEQLFNGELRDAQATYSDLQNMKYLELAIKEGLRLYSPVPIYARLTNEDVEYDGKIIPKGVTLLIFAHGVHMNPEYYPNPEKYDPSRFEQIDGTMPYAYIPFSAGSRNCIGQKFALLEIKSAVSKIVRNFTLLPAVPHHELQLSPEVVLKSSNGVHIGLRQR